MSFWSLILGSLKFYWRTQLGVVLGAALATLVLTGSLLVGDSVKATLRRQAELRVGRAEVALLGGDRFFRDQLASEVGPAVAPILVTRGSAARVDGSARVNQAQVLGVDSRFWQLAPQAAQFSATNDPLALVNQRLASALELKPGDTVVVRVEKPGLFSRDAPLSGEENEVVALRVKISGVLTDENYGRFGLQSGQVPPLSLFLPLGFLQNGLGMKGRANLLLASNLGASELEAAVRAHWQLADAGLELRTLEAGGGLELRTSRVFLDPAIERAAPDGIDSLTYLVNEISAGGKSVPYSMVSALDAAGSGFLPAELSSDEIVLSQWLADDLGIGNGDQVTLKYFVMGDRRKLEERERKFHVLSVLPMDEPHLNGSWMPDFPGLADKKSCRDWKPGFEMDVSRFRDKDEEYWQKYRGTPKAFINIAVGQEMWGNRWGQLTAVRYLPDRIPAEISKNLRQRLDPTEVGMRFVKLREQALAATKAPVDFGELFVSFSFFLIAAAAVLTGLLFVFAIEQRHAQAGLLLALGWRPCQVRRLFLCEGGMLALVGSLIGVLGAVFYTKAVLAALATVWRGAVGAVQFELSLPWSTLVIGLVSGVGIAVLAMWLVSRRQFRHSARELLTGELESGEPKIRQTSKGWMPWAAGSSLLGAGAIAGLASGAEAFFGAGALLLIGGLLSARIWLRASAAGARGLEKLAELGRRNAGRRAGRSLATIAVLASGIFMVVAVDSFRQRPSGATLERESGTGGFALVGESALPIYEDLNGAKGRDAYALDEGLMKSARVVPLRLREGDDASCLNLNRALEPRLLGVKPEELTERGAFRLEWPGRKGWSALADGEDPNVVPGVTDEATLRWALQMKLGDTLQYRDDRGQLFRVRIEGVLKGSLLQGSVLIAESRFTQKFPSLGGSRFFLIDAPLEEAGALAVHLSRAFQDRGLELSPAWRRLAEFQAVENTYLSIFQVLGGLGLLLGSAGLAIVVARNVLERRSEFGLLEALGFRSVQIRRLVLSEHRWLVAVGLLLGVASALVAVSPALRDRSGGFPFQEMGLLLAGLSLGCWFWVWLATWLALRGSRLSALRAE